MKRGDILILVLVIGALLGVLLHLVDTKAERDYEKNTPPEVKAQYASAYTRLQATTRGDFVEFVEFGHERLGMVRQNLSSEITIQFFGFPAPSQYARSGLQHKIKRVVFKNDPAWCEVVKQYLLIP